MEIKDVFNAEPKEISRLLSTPGVGFYIPIYQREYSWGKDNINRLCEDIGHGLQMLVDEDKQDAMTFIGTLIVIHDTNYETVEPHIQGELPSRVYLVIDGQQRLTTLLMLNTLIHEDVVHRANKLKPDQNPGQKWLYRQVLRLKAEFEKTFEQDMDYGQEYRWYPKMIRASVDSWAREELYVNYASPIAAYLHGYSAHVRNPDMKNKYQHAMPDLDSEDAKKHEVIIANLKIIRAILRNVATGGDQELEIPGLSDIVDSVSLQHSLFKSEFPDEVKVELLNAENEGVQFQELMRIILFGRFLLERVAVAVVTAKNETYAFDMFEALNTTGEPLTAFETFRPMVIRAETLKKYETSPSRRSMKIIEGYLDIHKKAQDKQKATDRLLIPFALAESGKKLSKRLSEQRNYLRMRYEAMDNIDEKRLFVKHLAHTTWFIKEAWPDDKQQMPDISEAVFSEKELVLMCLDVLRKANHQITIAPLVRFFSQILSAPSENRDEAINSFGEAVKAITAFFALWRGSRQGTQNIDAYYRELMRAGFAEINVKHFARYLDNGQPGAADVTELKSALTYILSEKGRIGSKVDWVKQASENPIYGISKPLTSFLILSATHDTYPDPDNLGLPKSARENLLPMLTLEHWNGLELTVEHVAPQTRPEDGWDDSLYETRDLIDCLGNLTLVPKVANSSLGNRSWRIKRLMYKVFSAPTTDDLVLLLEEAKTNGIDLSDSTQTILDNAKYLPHVRAIGMVEGEWDVNLVKARSKRLGGLIWDRLTPWLDITS